MDQLRLIVHVRPPTKSDLPTVHAKIADVARDEVTFPWPIPDVEGEFCTPVELGMSEIDKSEVRTADPVYVSQDFVGVQDLKTRHFVICVSLSPVRKSSLKPKRPIRESAVHRQLSLDG